MFRSTSIYGDNPLVAVFKEKQIVPLEVFSLLLLLLLQTG